MTTVRLRRPSSVAAAVSSTAQAAWKRWLPFWHSIFYLSLIFSTAVLLMGSSYSWWQYVVICGLSLLLALWYSGCVRINPDYWRQHALVTMGYLAIGWACWLVLVIQFPTYLLLLFGLYAQVYVFAPMPWKIVAVLLLTTVSLWRQMLNEGSPPWLLLITGVSSTFGIILACYIQSIVRQSEERQRLIGELESTRQELAAAERQNGIVEERQRLAREIHDTLAQGFVSILLRLEAVEEILPAERGAVHEGLADVAHIARTNLAEARRLMWALQPEVFDHASLSEILTALARQRSEQGGVGVTAVITGQARSLQPEIEVILLRAAQEALTNVRKHAYASRSVMTLSYMDDDTVVLDVQDDGKGFTPTQTCPSSLGQSSGGFGLKALRERVEQWGGTLSIESAPGEGTTLTVVLPALRNEPVR